MADFVDIDYVFNVEKKDTFVIVGGTVSPPMELIIIKDDGTKYDQVYDEGLSIDDLGDEYSETVYSGEDDAIFSNDGSIDVNALNQIKGFDPDNPDNSLLTDLDSKYKISKDKEANIKAIISAAKSSGVTNKYAISGILAVISKETAFIPRCESSYAKTSSKRIINIFGNHGYSESQWDSIKKDFVKFFNIVYGNKYGNGSNDGYKYRGRGFNQITFKSNYRLYYNRTGFNIVDDPDLLNTVEVASKCVIEFFKIGINGAPSWAKQQYHFNDINSFSNLTDATGAMYHINAGWGHSYNEVVSDSTGGRKKAFANVGPLYNTYQSLLV